MQKTNFSNFGIKYGCQWKIWNSVVFSVVLLEENILQKTEAITIYTSWVISFWKLYFDQASSNGYILTKNLKVITQNPFGLDSSSFGDFHFSLIKTNRENFIKFWDGAQDIYELWWWWIVFVVWLTNGRCLALFPAWNIVRDPYQHKSLTCRMQDLNLSRTWVQALLNEVIQ